MSNDAQNELLRSQNRTKRAIAESVAEELGDIIPRLNKTSQRMKELCSTVTASWEGAAANAFIESVSGVADSIAEMGSKAKTVSSSIVTAAQEAYPET